MKKSNRQIGKEPMDGQFLIKLPRELRERGHRAARVSGDGNLSAMVRRLIKEESDHLRVR